MQGGAYGPSASYQQPYANPGTGFPQSFGSYEGQGYQQQGYQGYQQQPAYGQQQQPYNPQQFAKNSFLAGPSTVRNSIDLYNVT